MLIKVYHLEKIDSMTDKSLMPSLLKKSAELGMLGVNISEEYGGIDLDVVTTLIFGEAMPGIHLQLLLELILLLVHYLLYIMEMKLKKLNTYQV